MTKQVTPKQFQEGPFTYHEEVECKIDALTNLGAGIGRIDGWVVLVPFTLPGERVLARIYKNHKNYSEADLVEVFEASEHRRDPKCQLFGVCGGCQYQHLDYAEQLSWKQQQVQELLERIGKVHIEVEKTIGSPNTYHYRSKLTPHYPAPKFEDFPIGFHKHGQRRHIVDVPQCPIATEAINKALPDQRLHLKQRIRGKKKGGTLLLRHSLEGVGIDPKAIVSERVGKLIFQFTAGEFFQNNPFILESFVDHVIREAQDSSINYLVDAYCGSGLFSLSAAAHFEAVSGIEISAESIRWARTNASINQIDNVAFHIGNADSIFAKVPYPNDSTTVIIDPPRKGCDANFLKQLMQYNPARLIYISCAPDTQARDLAYLHENGYKVMKAQPFDLFPQTRHIENVLTLLRTDIAPN